MMESVRARKASDRADNAHREPFRAPLPYGSVSGANYERSPTAPAAAGAEFLSM
jgi:hypothetical protein